VLLPAVTGGGHGLDAVCAAVAAVLAFLVVRRDVGTTRAALVAAVALVAVGLGWLATLFLALLAFGAALVVYVVLTRPVLPRTPSTAGKALALAAGTYVVLTAAAVAVVAVSTMWPRRRPPGAAARGSSAARAARTGAAQAAGPRSRGGRGGRGEVQDRIATGVRPPARGPASERHRAHDGPVGVPALVGRREGVVELRPFRPWPQDVLRHAVVGTVKRSHVLLEGPVEPPFLREFRVRDPAEQQTTRAGPVVRVGVPRRRVEIHLALVRRQTRQRAVVPVLVEQQVYARQLWNIRRVHEEKASPRPSGPGPAAVHPSCRRCAADDPTCRRTGPGLRNIRAAVGAEIDLECDGSWP
jgi:hypothetical protein